MNPDSPAISVLLACRSGEADFLYDSVRSLDRQTVDDFEAILCHTSDAVREREIAQDVLGSRLRPVDTGEKNLAEARNVGLEMANGDYIAILDSDDVSPEPRLEEQASILNSRPGVDLVGQHASTARVIDETGAVISPHSPESGRSERGLSVGCHLVNSSAMFRNGGYRYRGKFQLAEDYDLWLRIADPGYDNVVISSTDWVTSRSREGSMTSEDPDGTFDMAVVARLFRQQREESGEDAYDDWCP